MMMYSTPANMNTKQRLRWEKSRTLGPLRFILLYGVLGWGVSTGVLFSILFTMLGASTNTLGAVALLAVPAFAVGGLAWGGIMWIAGEWEYQKHMGRNNE
jgi:hypothetical protein